MKTAVIYDKWLSSLGGGEVVACTIARILKDSGYDVLFLSANLVKNEVINRTLGINLDDITFKTVSNKTDIAHATNKKPDLFINISFMDFTYGFGKKNIYYIHFPSPIRSGFFNFILSFFENTHLHHFFPKIVKEKINDRLRAGIYPDTYKRLNSYDTFVCHSEYVREWVKAMWDKEAEVLYPPVKLIISNPSTSLRTSTKKNWITSVGRFFTLGHGKKQEVLIEAFKTLQNQLKQTNLELHLVGGVGKEPSSLRYVEELKKMAEGYPIFFHFDAKRAEVEQILLQSKIYWHAGGYGETEPINFEHFGIAPVEAISAGCIPILFNGGGLVEIIEKIGFNASDHLFNSSEELINNTLKFISSSHEVSVSEGDIAEKLMNCFSSTSFKTKLLKLIHGN